MRLVAAGLLATTTLVAAMACTSRPAFVEAPILSASAAEAFRDAGRVAVAPTVSASVDPPKRDHPSPFHPGDAWTGSLVCAQGRASLALRVVSVQGDEVRALLDFTRATTGVSGRFSAVGTYNETSRQLRLQGEDWVARPPGAPLLDLDGRLASDQKTYTGRAVGPGCGFFHLRR